MHIEELSREASLQFLADHHLGRLACVRNAQPYITPFTYVYHQQCIYSFATLGKKVEWLRANPLACVEVDDITSPALWTTVIVSGRYEELVDTPGGDTNRQLAFKLLGKHDLWWEPGYVKTVVSGSDRPLEPIYFCISIDEITGHTTAEKELR